MVRGREEWEEGGMGGGRREGWDGRERERKEGMRQREREERMKAGMENILQTYTGALLHNNASAVVYGTNC